MSAAPSAPEILVLDPGFKDLADLSKFSFTPIPFSSLEALKKENNIKAVITNGAIGLPKAFFDVLPALELISVFGVGFDRISFDDVKSRGIKVTTTASITADAVAESAVLFLLNLRRRFWANFLWMKEGLWKTKGEPPLGNSLRGSRAGIVGFGAIGQSIAHKLKAFGAEVRYYNRSVRGEEFERMENLQDLAQWADALLLAIPSTAETRDLINDEILRHLGPKGVLVNVARGNVVNEKALLHALKEGIIQGAGLDVFVTEPEVNPAFFTLSNCILQPHQGSATLETRQAMAYNVIENLKAHFSGEKLITPLAGFA